MAVTSRGGGRRRRNARHRCGLLPPPPTPGTSTARPLPSPSPSAPAREAAVVEVNLFGLVHAAVRRGVRVVAADAWPQGGVDKPERANDVGGRRRLAGFWGWPARGSARYQLRYRGAPFPVPPRRQPPAPPPAPLRRAPSTGMLPSGGNTAAVAC